MDSRSRERVGAVSVWRSSARRSGGPSWLGAVILLIAYVHFGTPLSATPTDQVEVDRIVARIAGRIITLSDIRQARALRLVDDPASDESTRAGLEERLLILAEIGRAAPVAPATDEAVAARRGEWVERVGGASAVPGILAAAGMTEAGLQSWFRDDLRIRAYLTRQFGALAEGERARATAEWLARLRQRADVR
jgi:hypothetical protein